MANDNKNLIIATAKIRAHATLPSADPELPESYTEDFGEVAVTIKAEGDIKENWNAEGGVLGLSALKKVKRKLTYEFDIKYLSPAVLARYMGVASGGAPKPGKVVDLYWWIGLQMEDEPSNEDGEGIFVHHSFQGGLLIDGDLAATGEDFAGVKAKINAYLGNVPGVVTYGARPIEPVTP